MSTIDCKSISGKRRKKSENQGNGSKRRIQTKIDGFEDEVLGTQIKDCRQSLEAGRGKESDSPLVFRRNRVNPMRFMSDFRPLGL